MYDERIFSQKGNHYIDYNSERSISEAADIASKENPIDLVIVTNGILHDGEMMPEKSLRDLSSEKFYRIFEVNTIIPALIAKYFLPKLNKKERSIFVALSARVGSISDNKLGGWYSYRASKAALNMIIKNASIEVGRKNKQAIILGVHPGTVDSNLSKPFQRNISSERLFTPEYSAEKILDVLNQNPTMKIDIRSHTDSRQTFKYNEALSNKSLKKNRIIRKKLESIKIELIS